MYHCNKMKDFVPLLSCILSKNRGILYYFRILFSQSFVILIHSINVYSLLRMYMLVDD